MAVNAFLTFYDKADGATDSFRFTDYKPTESLKVDPSDPSVAVDPTNPDVGSSGHPGGVNAVLLDGSVRFLNASITDSIWIDMGAPPADGYLNPSSFQIVAAGRKGEAEPQLTSEPTAPADERSAPSVSEIVVTKVTDSTSPLSEVDHNEFRIIKLVDAAADFQPELTTESTDAGAVAGIVIAATSDNNRLDIDDGADVLTGDTFDFQPQFTTEPTAPEPGYAHWRVNYGRSGGFADGHNDGGLVINWLPDSDDGGIIVDYTLCPDDNVGLPAADGLLLPY